jgi:hypothetical protein
VYAGAMRTPALAAGTPVSLVLSEPWPLSTTGGSISQTNVHYLSTHCRLTIKILNVQTSEACRYVYRNSARLPAKCRSVGGGAPLGGDAVMPRAVGAFGYTGEWSRRTTFASIQPASGQARCNVHL